MLPQLLCSSLFYEVNKTDGVAVFPGPDAGPAELSGSRLVIFHAPIITTTYQQ